MSTTETMLVDTLEAIALASTDKRASALCIQTLALIRRSEASERRLEEAGRVFVEAHRTREVVKPHLVPNEAAMALLREGGALGIRQHIGAFGVYQYNTETGEFYRKI